MSAQYGNSAGSSTNVVTKAGTNNFHGSAWEFNRNDYFDANNFFLNQGGQPRNALRYNNYGGNFSGPVIKDRIFFFWSEEWRRELRGVTRQSTVPTLLERQGNFSGPHSNDWPTPTNPFTGNPFPNNTIPQNQLSPA